MSSISDSNFGHILNMARERILESSNEVLKVC
jgi:hypothetical protein